MAKPRLIYQGAHNVSPRVECRKCGERFIPEYKDNDYVHVVSVCKYNYCPNCGEFIDKSTLSQDYTTCMKAGIDL